MHAPRPRRLVAGFVLLMLAAPLLGGTPDRGVTVGFMLVLGVGALVGALLGRLAR